MSVPEDVRHTITDLVHFKRSFESGQREVPICSKSAATPHVGTGSHELPVLGHRKQKEAQTA